MTEWVNWSGSFRAPVNAISSPKNLDELIEEGRGPPPPGPTATPVSPDCGRRVPGRLDHPSIRMIGGCGGGSLVWWFSFTVVLLLMKRLGDCPTPTTWQGSGG